MSCDVCRPKGLPGAVCYQDPKTVYRWLDADDADPHRAPARAAGGLTTSKRRY
jgi:hypothetical protein